MINIILDVRVIGGKKFSKKLLDQIADRVGIKAEDLEGFYYT